MAGRGQQKPINERLEDAQTSLQFLYFLINTDHSFEDYTAAGGKVPSDMREKLTSLIGPLRSLGIITDDQIQTAVSGVVDGLDEKEIVRIFQEGELSPEIFEQMYANAPDLQAAVKAGFEAKINETALGAGLTQFAGITLDTDQFEMPDGSNLLDIKLGDLFDDNGVVDQTKIDTLILGTFNADGKQVAPPALDADQIETILVNLPLEQAKTAIENLTTKADGSRVEGYDRITLSDNASRVEIKAAVLNALDLREAAEGGLLASAWTKARGTSVREEILNGARQSVAEGFGETLTKFRSAGSDILSPEGLYDFIQKNENGQAEALIKANLDDIKKALRGQGDNLDLFINMLPPDQINAMFVDKAREMMMNNPYVKMIMDFVKPFIQQLVGAFPKIGEALDVVANTQSGASQPPPDPAATGVTDPVAGTALDVKPGGQ